MNCKLYAWGANSYGQLSLGNTEDQLLPAKINLDCVKDGIVCLATGGGAHSFILTNLGTIYSCGNNERGQLGQGHRESPVLSFKPVCFPHHVLSIACGWDFTLALVENGKVFACGSNAFGQLGNGLASGQETLFKQVEGLPGRARCIASGLRHSIAVTEDGDVYVWGNGTKGQLGQGNHTPRCEPVPRKVPLEVACKAVSAGSQSCVALSEQGQVFCWGSNQYSQSGAFNPDFPSGKKCLTDPHLVSLPEKIKMVLCGWTHVIARGESNQYYGWGRVHYGQLPVKEASQEGRMLPALLSLLPTTLEGIAVGAEHNIAFDAEHVYTWGWNEHGMCATGDEIDVHHLHCVDLLKDKHVTHIGCGAGTSFVFVSQGTT